MLNVEYLKGEQDPNQAPKTTCCHCGAQGGRCRFCGAYYCQRHWNVHYSLITNPPEWKQA